MNKLIKYQQLFIIVFLTLVLFASCKDLYETDQALDIKESELYGDWYEYRSAIMGLYGLQQNLAEQLLILGELRGDLLTITGNADPDMVEIYNFNVSKTNKYASPTNFFKLISACNSFLRIVKEKHPEVADTSIHSVSNFDRLYAEALCMRAWAYFNAARIYGKVPYIHESLVTLDEIENYVNSAGNYIDSVHITYNIDGYHNDTIRKDTTYVKQLYDLSTIIDVFTNELENKIKVVEIGDKKVWVIGVDYALLNSDATWEVTTWHAYSMDALLGHMYLTRGDYLKAYTHFNKVIVNSTTGSTGARYDLNSSCSMGSWSKIFDKNIDNKEHIYSIWFNKEFFQQNEFQNFFINKYMLKPTKAAVTNWEMCRMGSLLDKTKIPPKVTYVGLPGDRFRGFGYSYVCGNLLSNTVVDYYTMLDFKQKRDFRSVNAIMEGCDTFVYKYSINKNMYAQDAHYIIYRAAGIHLYLAELFVYWTYYQDNGSLSPYNMALQGLLNDGSYKGAHDGDAPGYGISTSRTQLGVRGRVGLGGNSNLVAIPGSVNYDGVVVTEGTVYLRDSITNEYTRTISFEGDIPAKQRFLEDAVMNERALELAFEGERYYDLMRVAKRRNDPSYLATKVSARYPAGQREMIKAYLMNENNWYINYFQ